ncbi:unnamed protein product, partial [marine sediment metagenome]
MVTDEWQMLTCVMNTNDDTVKVYVDGTFYANTSGIADLNNNANHNMVIGYALGYGQYFDGLIDEFYFYGDALSDGMVEQLYNDGAGIFFEAPVEPSVNYTWTDDLNTNLVTYWNFDEGSGTNVEDVFSGKYNLTVTGNNWAGGFSNNSYEPSGDEDSDTGFG